MIRYKPFFEKNNIQYKTDFIEAFSKEKPKPESGYTIKRVKKKVDGKTVSGYEKVKKKSNKKSKKNMTKSQRKAAAKKAWKTRKKDSSGMKKSKKKAAQTRKLNKS